VYQRRARIAGGALATPPTAPLECQVCSPCMRMSNDSESVGEWVEEGGRSGWCGRDSGSCGYSHMVRGGGEEGQREEHWCSSA